jgi:hypothetical protein
MADLIPGQPASQPKLKAGVEFERTEHRLLRLSLVNEGENLECFAAWLPWQHVHSMTILLVKKNGKLIPEQPMIDDPIPGTFTIRRNEKLAGTIDLDRRFPTLAEALASDDVDLFWSFQLNDIKSGKSQRLGGWLLLPKAERPRRLSEPEG